MNIIIISPRRSGTHLITDLIVNNFGFERIGNHIDYDFINNDNVGEFISEMECGNKLAWSHYHDYNNFFEKDLKPEYIEKLKQIISKSKLIYIYRDIRDTISSYYFRDWNYKKFKDFKDFYENNDMRDYIKINNYNGSDSNLVDVLIDQHKNWFSLFLAREAVGIDINVISYEEIINDYSNAVKLIGDFIDQSTNDIVDVRLKSINDINNDVKYSYNDFRKGNVGEWINTFGLKWGHEIKEKYDDIVGYHVQQHINMKKLHKFHNPERKYFQIHSQNWSEVEIDVDSKLEPFSDYFPDNDYYNNIIDNRYELCTTLDNNVRYKHKVFFYENIVIKFLFPCKAQLNKKTFDRVIPIASKINLLKIFQVNETFNNLNITPNLLYTKIVDGILVVVQEQINPEYFVYEKFNLKSKINWDWMVKFNIYPQILSIFIKMFMGNVLLNDIISPHNIALVDNEITFVDLDGLHIFNNYNEMIGSLEYFNIYHILLEIDNEWVKVHGNGLISKTILPKI